MASAVNRLLQANLHFGPRAKLVIFNFHNISDGRDFLLGTSVTREVFLKQLAWIRSHFNILPLHEGIEECRSCTLHEPTACLTFDDGYRSHHSIAADILGKLNIPATFFVSSGHLGNTLLWNDWITLFSRIGSSEQKARVIQMISRKIDGAAPGYIGVPKPDYDAEYVTEIVKYFDLDRRKEVVSYIRECLSGKKLPRYMLSEDEVLSLRDQGFSIGAHTVNHPILAVESEEESRRQITADIDRLSSLLGQQVRVFAFPNGKPGMDYTEPHVRFLVDAGIQYAVTTAKGYFGPGCDPRQIPRINLMGTNSLQYLRNVLTTTRMAGDIVSCMGYETLCSK